MNVSLTMLSRVMWYKVVDFILRVSHKPSLSVNSSSLLRSAFGQFYLNFEIYWSQPLFKTTNKYMQGG